MEKVSKYEFLTDIDFVPETSLALEKSPTIKTYGCLWIGKQLKVQTDIAKKHTLKYLDRIYNIDETINKKLSAKIKSYSKSDLTYDSNYIF